MRRTERCEMCIKCVGTEGVAQTCGGGDEAQLEGDNQGADHFLGLLHSWRGDGRNRTWAMSYD